MEGEEEIREVAQKPESMLSPKVQQVLVEVVDKETEKALREGNDAYAMELQNAKKLVKKGCWSVRKANPFLEFMGDCLKGKGGDLKATQEAMQQCALTWSKLPPEKKKGTEELAVYDYL